MNIEPRKIKVIDLFQGYVDSGDDGVVAYNGILDIRPPYQREFVYDLKKKRRSNSNDIKKFSFEYNVLGCKRRWKLRNFGWSTKNFIYLQVPDIITY